MPEGERLKPWYPGLPAHEADLWRRWLEVYERQFYRFAYNVRVGRGLSPPEPADGQARPDEESYRRMWTMLTQRRIDAVAWRLDETWLLEVEPHPSARALGQLAMYEQLYTDAHPDTGFVQLAVVAETVSPDVRRVLESLFAVTFLFPVRVPELPG